MNEHSYWKQKSCILLTELESKDCEQERVSVLVSWLKFFRDISVDDLIDNFLYSMCYQDAAGRKCPYSTTQIANQLGLHSAQVSRRLSKLAKEKKLEKVTGSTDGTRKTMWRLLQGGPSHG
jgi:hypothetical protein